MPIRLFAFISLYIVWDSMYCVGERKLHNNYTYSKATKFYTHKCHPDIV